MVTQYDDKGKIFTQVVSKHPVLVTIQTVNNIIRGAIHIRREARVKDELNGSDRFLAVTEAVVYSLANEELYHSNFLVLNIEQIVWVIPEEEMNP